MRSIRTWAALLLPLALLGCQRAQPGGAQHRGAPAAPANTSGEWLLPSSPGASAPDLVATPDGRLLLSWIDRVPGRRNALQFAAWGSDDRWQSAPRTIVVGDSLLADVANTPHIAATADGALWVQWLQAAPDGGAESAAVMLARSVDGGFNWSAPVRVDTAAGRSGHGFATLWPAARSSIGVAWLDGPARSGRADARAGAGAAAHAADASGLRAAVFDPELHRSGDSVLDAMACDCCQTASAMTTRGALLAYRDRTPGDIRDIAVVRFDGSHAGMPLPVHADHWAMPACPVNGPAIAANGNAVVVGWYTGAGDMPAVKLARSGDGGASFGAPVVLEQGAAVQGRVAVALDAQQAWVLWLREDAGGQSLWLARYTPDLSRQLSRVQVAKLQGRGRATGVPQLALRAEGAYVAWTDVVDGAPQLRGARVAP